MNVVADKGRFRFQTGIRWMDGESDQGIKCAKRGGEVVLCCPVLWVQGSIDQH